MANFNNLVTKQVGFEKCSLHDILQLIKKSPVEGIKWLKQKNK